MKLFVSSLGAYWQRLIGISFWVDMGDSEWQSQWTIFYWAWWLSWAPFVGAFIAKISKGRTIREFVFGVILLPSIASWIWMSILGGTAIAQVIAGNGGRTT